MNDPERLQHDGDDFERSLLRSAHRDGPSREGKKRALMALGLGASVAASTATGAASAAATVAPTTAGLVAKWMLVGALFGGGVLVTSETLAPAPTPEPTAVRAVTPAAPLPDHSAAAPQAIAAVASADPVAVESAPAARPRAPEQRPAQPAAPEPPAPAPTPEQAASALPTATALPHDPLTGELLQLDAARSAMAQGNLATARAALDQYSARFPQGKLSTEAQIMRIELTWRQGDRQAATSAGQAFLAAHPASPHAPRLRALLGIAP